MRITKVIRDYMGEALSKKRLEANDNERAEYDARREECKEELGKLLTSINEDALHILRKYGMDGEVKAYGNMKSAPEAIFNFNPLYIKNAEEEKIFETNAHNRYEIQKEEMKRIELEAALGADKDAFMAMLEAVTFE